MNYVMEPAQLLALIQGFLDQVTTTLGWPSWIAQVVGALLMLLTLFIFCSLVVMVLVYAERKIAARMQARVGPMRVGWHGLLQVIADTIKLLFKETEVPAMADSWVYRAAPYVVFTAGFMALCALPMGRGLVPIPMNLGLLYMIAITTPGVIGILMASWGSSNKYALIGGMRSAAQMISYEIPLVISVLGVVMLARSLDLAVIVRAQQIPYILLQPIGFIIFLIAAVAETNRNPFDIPEAESELTAGFHTEYGGLRFAYFFLAEYVNMFVLSALAATLFLSGWRGPWLPGWLWYLLKTGLVLFVFIWFRWTFPRLRSDQLMSFCWKLLTPLAFLNLIVTGLIMVLN